MTEKPRFIGKFRDSCLIVAKQIHGHKGTWAYETFEFINDTYFDGRLPWPHIVWGLTAHGSCVAWASTASDKSRPPIITLHPSLLRASEKKNPWGIPGNWLGPLLAFDTLLHECIHVHVDYNLGGHNGRSSHDCPRWVRQVNRIAPPLGFTGIRVGITKSVRVKDFQAPRTKRGKVATRVVRETAGNVPFRIASGFPQSLRIFSNTADKDYSANRLPDGAPAFDLEADRL